MPVLPARTSVELGPYPKGAKLNITAPQTDNIYNFPTLNGVVITLTYLPKSVTLAQQTVYTLTAGAVDLTYNIT